MRNRRGSSARPTASGRSACRGRRCAPGSPPSLSGSRSTCSRRPTSAAPSGSCGSAGTRPGILERAVERGRRAKEPCATPHLGVDEKAIAKGHQYLTLVCDLDRSTVEYIAEDRKQASLEGYFTGLAADQLAGIEAIAMDMWEPYVQAIRAHVPDAESKIVFDRKCAAAHLRSYGASSVMCRAAPVAAQHWGFRAGARHIPNRAPHSLARSVSMAFARRRASAQPAGRWA